MADLIDNIIKTTLYGISKAQKDYETWSDGSWLWVAPEYMTTTSIAKEIAKSIKNKRSLTLEAGVRKSIEEAGGLGKGAPSKKLRLKGKFDILVRWASGKPRAIIEVKKHPENFSHIKADIERIIEVLRLRDGETTFRCGLIAYYTSRYSKSGSAKGDIIKRVKDIKDETHILIKGKELKLRQYPSPRTLTPKGDDNDAWIAVVLKISR